jgi:hydroxyacylglutathione hydrolase
MIIQSFTSGPLDTNAYIIACAHTRQAAIVDPAPGSAELIIPFIASQNWKVIAILLTHSHWDHFGDAAVLKDYYKVPVYIHPEDARNLEFPGSDRIPCWTRLTGVKPDHLLKEGDLISIGDLRLRVIHTPGHSPGSVCFYDEAGGILIAGDTLFHGSIGNLAVPTAEAKRMWPSLKKLAALPTVTKVYSGHGSPTTIGAEPWLPEAERYFGE